MDRKNIAVQELQDIYKNTTDGKKLYLDLYKAIKKKDRMETNAIKAELVSEMEREKLLSVVFSALAILISFVTLSVNVMIEYIGQLSKYKIVVFIIVIVIILVTLWYYGKGMSDMLIHRQEKEKMNRYILCVIEDVSSQKY